MLKLFLKWILLAGGAFGALYVLAFLIGLILPKKMETTDSILISRPPENVWWVLTDHNNAAMWHPQYRDSATISAPGERPQRWRVTYTDGVQANVEVTEETFPTHLAEHIADEGLPFTGGWKLDLERVESSCKVTVESEVEIRRPVERLFVRLFVRPTAELDKILNALKRRVESSTVKPSAATS